MSIYRVSCWVLFVLAFLLMAGCGPDVEEIAVTVEGRVAAVVGATLTAVPTATPYPTQTPYSTYTPYPVIPTYTPYPTYTPQPTDAPTVTYTPEPSITSTTAPTSALAPANEQSTDSGSAATPAGDPGSRLLAEIDKTRAEVEEYSRIITPKITFSGGRPTGEDLNIDCQAAVSYYDSIANILVWDVSSSDPVMQNAYNLYVTAVNQFKEITTFLTDGCREALANGQSFQEVGSRNSEEMRSALEEKSTNLLRQAIFSLSGE